MANGRKTGGRKPGSKNKSTVAVKGAIEKAFATLGGAAYLVRVGRKDPSTFCRLLGKLLPRDIDISVPLIPDGAGKAGYLEDARRLAFVIGMGLREREGKGEKHKGAKR